MFPLPIGTLTYISIDHSVVSSVIAGLFLLPFPLILLFMLFWCWQEDMWEEHKDSIALLHSKGFVVIKRSFWPRWIWRREEECVVLYQTPLMSWGRVRTENIQKRMIIKRNELIELIDLLDQQEATSMLQT